MTTEKESANGTSLRIAPVSPASTLTNLSQFNMERQAYWNFGGNRARLSARLSQVTGMLEIKLKSPMEISHTEKKVEPKRLHPWSRFMVRKNGSTLQGGTIFQNGSRVQPFWLHFFSQCSTVTMSDLTVQSHTFTIHLLIPTGRARIRHWFLMIVYFGGVLEFEW